MSPSNGHTTIVVPCYNEGERLDHDAYVGYLADHHDVRLIFVNDGSTDHTSAVLREIQRARPGQVDVIELAGNQGKAEAVRTGMLRAMEGGARLAGYWDADLATPLEAIGQFQETLDRRCDIDMVLGARVDLLGRQIDRKATRHYMGRVFATAASLTLDMGVYDTQCGAKLLRCSDTMASLFAEPFRSGWLFDVELIARYRAVTGSAAGLYELPLDEWTDVDGSKVRPIDFVRSVPHLARVYRRYRLPERYHRVFDVATLPFSRYVAAGAFGTVLHFIVLLVIVEGFNGSAVLGAAIGATFGAGVNYFLNYHLTFVSDDEHRRTLPRFIAVAALAIGLNAALMWLLVESQGMAYLLAQLIVVAVVLVVGFVLNSVWTFRDRRAAAHLGGKPAT